MRRPGRRQDLTFRQGSFALQFPHPEIPDLNLIPSSPPSPKDQDSPPESPPQAPQFRADLPLAKRPRIARYKNYVPEEETIRNDCFSAMSPR
ncbi:hypothetical protein FB451DRAFT_1298832 [Mycena latifolia]|nr:hypothetical protein FB451DRAFT_1298832 [Mycena latifolia]